jgi:FkbH-like protein
MLAKTNQFNLTTRRHSEATVRKMIEEDGNLLLTLSLSDRFGDQGIVGLCIALEGATRGEMIIDSFLLSCRALGRGAEDLLWSVLLKYLDERKCTSLQATYISSIKNIQVSEFYERLGMVVESTSEEETQYRMLPPYYAVKPAWIDV